MQHHIKPERVEFTVMFWLGDDLGVYKRTVSARSHPEAAILAVSRATDGAINSSVKKKAFKAVTMAALDDVESFEGPLDGSSMFDGIIRGPLSKDEWKAEQDAAKAARAAAKVKA